MKRVFSIIVALSINSFLSICYSLEWPNRFDYLVRELKSGVLEKKLSILERLNSYPLSKIEPYLLPLLDEKDPELRLKTASLLIQKGSYKGIERVAEWTLNSDDKQFRIESCNLLLKVEEIEQKVLREVILKLLQDQNYEIRLCGLKLIYKIKNRDQNIIKALISALDDPYRDIKVEVIRLMKKLKDPSFVLPLVFYLKEADVELRAYIAGILGFFDDKRVKNILILLLNDEDATVRHYALKSLQRIGDESVADTLATFIERESSLINKKLILETVVKLKGEKSLDIILKYIGDPFLQETAYKLLKGFKLDSSTVGELLKKVDLRDNESLYFILSVIKDLKLLDKGLAQYIVYLLLNGNYPQELKKDFVQLLSRSPSTTTIFVLKQFLKEPSLRLTSLNAIEELTRETKKLSDYVYNDILPLVKDRDSSISYLAIKILFRSTSKGLQSLILPLLKYGTVVQKRNVVRSLLEEKKFYPEYKEELFNLLKGGIEELSYITFLYLSELKPKEFISVLKECERKGCWIYPRWGMMALGNIMNRFPDKDYIEYISRKVKVLPSAYLKTIYLEAIGSIALDNPGLHPPSVLFQIFRESYFIPSLRVKLIETIGKFNHSEVALDFLLDVIRGSNDIWEKATALWEIGRFTDFIDIIKPILLDIVFRERDTPQAINGMASIYRLKIKLNDSSKLCDPLLERSRNSHYINNLLMVMDESNVSCSRELLKQIFYKTDSLGLMNTIVKIIQKKDEKLYEELRSYDKYRLFKEIDDRGAFFSVNKQKWLYIKYMSEDRKYVMREAPYVVVLPSGIVKVGISDIMGYIILDCGDEEKGETFLELPEL